MSALDPRDVWADVDASPNPALCVNFLDAFNDTPWLSRHKQRALDAFGTHPRGEFLEVGCGTGSDAQALARRLTTGKVVGIDPSSTMIRAAAKRAAGSGLAVEFRPCSTYELPFDDASFDGAYSLMTFDILEHPRAALREMARVVRPGGTVMVSASDHGSFVIDAPDRRLTRLLIESFCDGMHSGWIGRELLGAFAHCGLDAVEVVADTVMLRSADYAVARRIVLENMVGAAQQRGLVSTTEGRAWLDALDARHARGSFFAASTFFIVTGVKRSPSGAAL
jgi:ubiquinone/menaquinone biosynthesis C-methylase UbiE